MRQRVTRAVEDREGRAREALVQVDSRGVPDGGVLPAGDDERRPAVPRARGHGELPASADPLHRRRVSEKSCWRDELLVALEHRRRLHNEVAAESVVAQVVRADDGVVVGDVAHVGQQGADQCEPGDPVGLSRGEPLGVVAAGRVADEQHAFRTDDLVGESDEQVEDVIGALHRRG